ncbi:ATP-grasp domain-containing protein [Peribacillus cavernae]|uniref:ATP-grasp domain-containing protein n=1 Tax=Peribacillus cavernae TaxID=1674310 RepID=A0A433HHE7_9BACI|nr:ATP-grasp domain-containing protein [Peribacillus cavernae]MDQ0219386.1 gamma-F420-2:alpha-L-glutamate ligase [Peribacillus cavernae]RUQ27738.1 ATP-grasp domain-containing protein [Peribacillus cavernae]
MNPNGWLIYSSEDAVRNQAYIDWVLQEARHLDMNIQLLYREDFSIGHVNSKLAILHQRKAIELPSFAIVRTIDSLFTKQLELLGIKCYNSSLVSEICNNKAKTHQYMAMLGIPMADTIYGNGDSFDGSDVPFDYPYIAKEISGRGGKQVFLIKNENGEHGLKGAAGGWIIQKPAVYGKDLRVFIVGKKIIAAVLRQSETDFKANFTLGGSASLYELSERERDIVEKIINTIDFGMAGIDFVFSEDGSFLLNEIEDVVGSRTLSALSDINIVRDYLLHIKSEL